MSKNSRVTGKTVVQLQRVQPAKDRQEARDSRSGAEQLALLDQRPGQARKERQRLAVR